MVDKEAESLTTKPEDRPPTEAAEESYEIKGKPNEGESFQELYEESLHEIPKGRWSTAA